MSAWFWTTWNGFGPETKASLIGGLTTLIAAFMGGFAIVLQIRHQGKLNRDNVKEMERRRIKAELYEEVQAACRGVSDAAIEFANLMLSIGQSVEVAATFGHRQAGFPLPAQRIPQLIQVHGDYHNAGLKLIFLIEQRRFVDPRMIIFITAIQTVLHDVREYFHTTFFLAAINALPFDDLNGQTRPYQAPSMESAEALKQMTHYLFNRSNDLGSYAEDFLVEMQNLLVADLFKTHVGHRQPLDPSAKVIRLDDFDELEQHFNTNTAWGTRRSEIEANTRKHFEFASTEEPS